MPVVWLYCSLQLIQISPCFVAFVMMKKNNHDVESRERLYKTYRNMAVYFGLPAHVLTYFYTQYKRCKFFYFICDGLVGSCQRICGPISTTNIVIEAVIALSMLAFFRIYFLRKMYAYFQDGLSQTQSGSNSMTSPVGSRRDPKSPRSARGSEVKRESDVKRVSEAKSVLPAIVVPTVIKDSSDTSDISIAKSGNFGNHMTFNNSQPSMLGMSGN